jgi:acetate kinase
VQRRIARFDFLQEELKEHEDRRVRLAIEMFRYRARKYIGAFLACMCGADAVIFRGGIGEKVAHCSWSHLRRSGLGRFEAGREENQRLVGLEGQISSKDSSLPSQMQ